MTSHPNSVELIAVATVLYTVTTAFIILRVYVSATRPTPNLVNMKVSDGFILFGWSVITAGWIASCYRASKDIQYKGSKDPVTVQYGLPKSLHKINGKLVVLEVFAYYTAIWAAKGAFLSMYFGLTAGLSTMMRRMLYFAMVYAALGFVALVFLSGFMCRPFRKNWEFGPNACRLVSAETVLLSTVLNISTDVLIMLLPLFILRSFTIRSRDKLAILFLMALGLASIAAASVRLLVFSKMHLTDSLDLDNQRKIEVISMVEVAAVTIAASGPSLRAWFMRRKTWRGGEEGSGSERGGKEGKKPGEGDWRLMRIQSLGSADGREEVWVNPNDRDV